MEKLTLRVIKGIVAGGRPRIPGAVIALDDNMDTRELLAWGVVEEIEKAPADPEPTDDPTAVETRIPKTKKRGRKPKAKK